MPHPQSKAVWEIFMAAGVLFAVSLWLLLNVLGILPGWLKAIAPHVPGWLRVANLALAPILAAVVSLRIPIPPALRLLLSILFLVSISGLALAGEKYRWKIGLVILFLYVEAFWIIPKVNSRLALQENDSKN